MHEEEKQQKQSDRETRIERELLTHDKENKPLDSWRIFKIMAEFVSGFELIRKYGKTATIFGSSRCEFDDDVYQKAEALAARLAEHDFAVITGGGPGVMEAANKGAFEADGHSVGLNITLPAEQQKNAYLTADEEFHYFFTRKVMLSFASEVYVFLPGGFGTMDEFFELVTLVQTKKIKRLPIVLIDAGYWGPLLEWVRACLYERYGAIDESDMDIYHVVDSVDEAVAYITERVNGDTR
jgi:hypothetical protein